VIECCPAVRLDVEYVAMPEPFNVAVPNVVEPSINVTEPIGVPVPVVVTVAVNVIEEPDIAGFELDANAVVVAKRFTV
jgi:hypothetical protein